jgi:nucleoside-diphosphate-sugar epimerase
LIEERPMSTGYERVFITGASGFIGACLARDLIASGADVHLALRREANLWRLAGLEGEYTPHWADVRDAEALRRAVADCRPDVVYHLANHGAYHYQKDRSAVLNTNFMGTANMLDALEGHDYRALVYTGSSSEYGHKDGLMRPGDRLEPRTEYAVSKAAGTMLCLAEAYKGKPVSCVRVFSAYGPWEEPGRLVPYVMGCCARGETPKVTPGFQPRDFVYVDDVVALIKLAAHHPSGRGQVLHAGTGQQHYVRDMIETIVAVCAGGRIRPEYGSAVLRPDEPTSWVASIEETTALTGWKPRHDLRGGVAAMWKWFGTSGALKAA